MLLSVNAGSCYPGSQGSVLCEWGAGALWILSWEWVSHHLHDCLLGSQQLGFPHCALNTEETALTIALLLLQGGRFVGQVATRLEGRWEMSFHSGAFRHLRAPQQWIKLSFCSSCPSLKSPSLGNRVPASQVFTNLPAALRWDIHPRVQFTISWIRETGLPPEHLFQTEAQCQSVDKWLRGACCWGCWGCLCCASGIWWCSWVLDSVLGVVKHLAHTCCDTEDLRGLAHWNLPSLGFCRMRSGHYKSEVTNREACRFFSNNPN